MSEDKKAYELIAKGGIIAGGFIGEALAFFAIDPITAGAAGAIGAIIPILTDITNRVLSKREEIRVGATAAFALVRINSYLKAGHKPRQDGFFDNKDGARSDAQEIFEGVLLKAKNEHEEKKARILGNIFANVAFWPGFSVGEANHVLQITNNSTYRQLCAVAFIEKKGQLLDIKLREKTYREISESIKYETISILQEIYDMHSLGLIYCKGESGSGRELLRDAEDLIPSRLALDFLGRRYYRVMELVDIPDDDLKDIARHLK